MRIAGERVLTYLQKLRLAPRSITALTGEDLSIARIVGVEGALGQVHRLSIGRKAAGSFFVLAIEVALDGFNRFPFAFVIFLCEEDVCALGSRDAAYLVAFGVISGAGEVEHVVFVAKQSGAEVASTAGQYRFLLDAV